MSAVELYHFTNREHLAEILAAGQLTVTESNVSFKREHAGPDVVWLTTHTNADAGLGLQGSHYDKGEIRFTVRLDKRSVHDWRTWARAHGSPPYVMAALAETGGGAASWRLTERPIPAAQWVEIRNMRTGDLINPTTP